MRYQETARVVDLIYRTYPQFGETYGPKVKLTEGVLSFLDDIEKTLVRARKKVTKGTECVVFDWAGIGDTVHTRLIIQHLAREQKVCWVTVPLVAPLYKDDTIAQVLSGFASPYRDPRQTWIRDGLCEFLHNLFVEVFDGFKTVDVSYGVGKFWGAGWKQDNYANLFFGGAGVERDPEIKHTLTHKGTHHEKLPERYIAVESTSISFGTLPVDNYVKMVNSLKAKDIETVQVGGPSDLVIPNAISALGMNLYDTFSVLKGSLAFVGRSSGNQSLMVFLPAIPVFEVEIPPLAGLTLCGYRDNVYSVGYNEFPEKVRSCLESM